MGDRALQAMLDAEDGAGDIIFHDDFDVLNSDDDIVVGKGSKLDDFQDSDEEEDEGDISEMLRKLSGKKGPKKALRKQHSKDLKKASKFGAGEKKKKKKQFF